MNDDLLTRLPIVVLDVYSRCNCRCGMCDIWKATDAREMPASFVERHVDELVELGTQWVVLTGGEPLMHSELFRLTASLRGCGIRVTVLTAGLLVARHADQIVEHVDDLIVSLDGPPEIHDRIRGVRGAFERLQEGVAAVRRHRSDFPIAARCTVQKENHRWLGATVNATRQLGLNSISFLAVDAGSTAFNRTLVWDGERQGRVTLSQQEVAELEREVEAVIEAADPLVVDSPSHLRRIVERFRAYAGLAPHTAPRCNAPWVSAVIEADGRVRPCFFHAPVGVVNGSVKGAINGAEAQAFRRGLDVASDEVCGRCVCSLVYQG